MLYRALIPKSRFHELLASLSSGGWRVVAPARIKDRIEFRQIQSPDEALFGDEIPYMSPKEFLFPMQEAMLRFDAQANAASVAQAPKTAIFGVKPCDLYALELLHRVFSGGKYPDAPYLARRESTLLIGAGCASPKPGCFCGERGIAMDNSGYCDLFLLDEGEGYLADVNTPAGAALLEEFLPGLKRGAPKEAPPPPPQTLSLRGEEKDLFERVDWERIAETCLGCGVCTYLCPACHCFEFRDVEDREETTRYRCWDSCMYPKFTLHALGHNPRPATAQRYRQRLLHKFLYLPENVGMAGCSGCGRCIRSCPAGMNIREAVRGIMEELP